MVEARERYVKWNKPDFERQILHEPICGILKKERRRISKRRTHKSKE